MKTLLEQVINELKISKASTGNKLNQISFEQLEVGDIVYFAFVSPSDKLNFTGKIYKKENARGNNIIYWHTGEKTNDALLIINTMPRGLKAIDGNFSTASGCVVTAHDDYWIYATNQEYFKQKLKELFNLEIKDLETN